VCLATGDQPVGIEDAAAIGRRAAGPSTATGNLRPQGGSRAPTRARMHVAPTPQVESLRPTLRLRGNKAHVLYGSFGAKCESPQYSRYCVKS
jgi:hypothetical protein